MTTSKPIDVEAAQELVTSERWVSKVRVDPSGCHRWLATRTNDGYGRIRLRGPMVFAHRVAWIAANGYNPDPKLELDHFVCNNPSCVNADHVRLVTHRENTLRGDTITAARLARTHCPKGHPLSGSNLRTDKASVAEGARRCLQCQRQRQAESDALIREARRVLGITLREYRERYGQSKDTARRIIERGEAS
jgi:hypothetical protein